MKKVRYISNGYAIVTAPEDYPGRKTGGRYCSEHHLVWWQHTGELVTKGEVIHHKNRDRADNRIENLERMTNADHLALHKPDSKRPKPMEEVSCTKCGKQFSRAKSIFEYKRRQGKTEFFCGQSCATKTMRENGKCPGRTTTAPHGTSSRYDYQKCRCDLCVEAKRKRGRDYRERKRAELV